MSEWYADGPLGIEQGFTIARPVRGGAGALSVSLVLSGDLSTSLSDAGRALALSAGGRAVLSVADLVASDAEGRVLRSCFELSRGRLTIRVDARGAAYPVRIDPMLQVAKLTASGGEIGFSLAVSADGSTVVASAPFATVIGHAGQGAVYVFTEPRGWSTGSPAAKLTAADGAALDELGGSVGVSADGSGVFAGAPAAMVNGNAGQGAVYVFTEPESGWSTGTQTAKLTYLGRRRQRRARLVGGRVGGRVESSRRRPCRDGERPRRAGGGVHVHRAPDRLVHGHADEADRLGWRRGRRARLRGRRVCGRLEAARRHPGQRSGSGVCLGDIGLAVSVGERAGCRGRGVRDLGAVCLGDAVRWKVAVGDDHLHGVRAPVNRTAFMRLGWDDGRQRGRVGQRIRQSVLGVHAGQRR